MQTDNTITAYGSDWHRVRDVLSTAPTNPADLATPLSVEDVLLYIESVKEQVSVATLRRHMSAINHFHRQARLLSPTYHVAVRERLGTLAREQDRPPRRARGLSVDDMTRIVIALDKATMTDAKRARDRALLLVGWWSRLERKALVSLRHGDVKVNGSICRLVIRHGRRPQEIRFDRALGILDAGAAYLDWVEESGNRGPVFLSINRWGHIGDRLDGRDVNRIMKEAAGRVFADVSRISGNSLRWRSEG